MWAHGPTLQPLNADFGAWGGKAGLPSPRGMHGQRGRASSLERLFHKEGTACSVSLWGKQGGIDVMECLGLGFGKWKAVFLGHAVVFAGRSKGWPTPTWFGVSVRIRVHVCLSMSLCVMCACLCSVCMYKLHV